MTTNSSLPVRNTTNNNSTGNSTPAALLQFPSSQSVDIFGIVALSVLIPLTFAGNMLVCVVFIKYQRLRTATNCFLFSLALSDLAVGLILIPFWMAVMLVGLSPNLFTFYMILDITCSVASMANLASVSIERWYGVTYPFRHMSMSAKKAALIAACSWLYALCTALLFLANKAWVLSTIIVLGLCVPFLIMVMSYCGIARKIRQKTTTVSPQSGRECKTIRTLILISVIFLICWLPFVVASLITNHCVPCTLYVHQRPILRTFVKVLHYANSCLNPVLYALLSPSFKSAYKQLFFGNQLTRSNGRTGRPRRLRTSLEPSMTGISVIKKTNVVYNLKGNGETMPLHGGYSKDKCVNPDRESSV